MEWTVFRLFPPPPFYRSARAAYLRCKWDVYGQDHLIILNDTLFVASEEIAIHGYFTCTWSSVKS